MTRPTDCLPHPSHPKRVEADPGSHIFERSDSRLGSLALRPLRIPDDMPCVHAWVRLPYARFWGMNGLSLSQVTEAYREITAPWHAHAYMGLHAGEPAFILETYSPSEEAIAELYPARLTDRGMHLLLAPPRTRLSGFSFAVFQLVMDFLFRAADVTRVVVEPDIENHKIHALNARAGFRVHREVDLPALGPQPPKRALLSFCEREDYARAMGNPRGES